MRTLILYASRYGTSKECAERIARLLSGPVDVKSAANLGDVTLSRYDRVIIGGGVYAGTLDQGFKQYLDQKTGELLQKRIALFLCGTASADKVIEQCFAANYPPKLLKGAIVTSHFGGRIAFTKMKGISKLLLGFALKKQIGRKVSTREDFDSVDLHKVEKFAREFDKATAKGKKGSSADEEEVEEE